MKVYKITNILNNKSYITFTKKENIKIKKFSNDELNNDVKTLGIENFKLEIISECLNKKEAH
jgi:hypothetical protein